MNPEGGGEVGLFLIVIDPRQAPSTKRKWKAFTRRTIGRSLNHKFSPSFNINLINSCHLSSLPIPSGLFGAWENSKNGNLALFVLTGGGEPILLFFSFLFLSSGWDFWMYSLLWDHFWEPTNPKKKVQLKKIKTCWDYFKVFNGH